MGKTKVGKQRKDKYYQRAKDLGYRSRAAFKLIQLNRGYEFLQKSKVCIDLCAAPGGWMQVAQQTMPVSSIIIGVDLFPIKPIPGCISIVEDITTDRCKVLLKKELQDWKVDLVLHDGAPNVGKNWLHDAYGQNCLTLSAIKLASQFLRKGGWFVTKVFRSKDYNSLMWVLKQLFKEVREKKPLASRNESAETFIVCRSYLAPETIDPQFFDIKYVFKDLDLEPLSKLNVFHPEKQKKAKALGYPENNLTLQNKVSVKDFIIHENGVDLLEHASEIIFDDENITNHPKTTEEIKQCCKDIKVLGRKDLKLLLAWWKALHNERKVEVDEEAKTDEEKDGEPSNAQMESEDELQDVEKAIAELEDEEKKDRKRKKKKVLKEKAKLVNRLNLKMIHKGDTGPVLEADDYFELKKVRNLQDVLDQNPDTLAEPESDEEDREPKPKRVKFNVDEGHLDSSGLFYRDSDSEDSESNEDKEGLEFSDEEEKEDDDKNDEESTSHPLLTDLDNRSAAQKRAHKAKLWFSRDSFKDLLTEEDVDADLDAMTNMYKQQGIKIIGEEDDEEKEEVKNENVKEDKKVKIDVRESDDSDSDESDYFGEKEYTKSQLNSKKDGFEIVKPNLAKQRLTPEELALGTVLISSRKARRDIIDAGWNRYAFNDENLPSWFVEHEKKYMRKPVNIPQEYVNIYNKALEEINARPIKKVMEAKARKKRRALKKMAKMKKKVEVLMDSTEVSERDKIKQVRQLYKKATEKKKEEITYVVSKKQKKGGKVRSKPSGIKGRYKVVDPRMKKDLKAEKKKDQKMKGQKKKRSKGRKK